MKNRHVLTITAFLALALCMAPSLAGWNMAGHMTSGAIAYQALKAQDPEALAAVVELLKEHPYYELSWRHQVNQSFVPEEDKDLYLFMLAARWPDDVRNVSKYHRGSWHYINHPYKPPEAPPSVREKPPANPNLETALEKNLEILRSGARNKKKGIALAWLFHLVGDCHQPLHSTALFSSNFSRGDRGGTRFYIRVTDASQTISLHKFWDDLVIGASRFTDTRNTGTRLRNELPRPDLKELEPPVTDWNAGFKAWVQESFQLAISHGYRHGTLQGSKDEDDGAVLPGDYREQTMPVAERRMVLAGYRLADLLSGVL